MAAGGSERGAEKELSRLRRKVENRTCPNCLKQDSMGFTAVCMTFKTFICSECKSAHQGFSHRCKSALGSFWSMDEVASLSEQHGGGNTMAAAKWLANAPDSERPVPGESTLEGYKRFIQRAYIEERWAGPPASPAETCLPAGETSSLANEGAAERRQGCSEGHRRDKPERKNRRSRARTEDCCSLGSPARIVASDVGVGKHERRTGRGRARTEDGCTLGSPTRRLAMEFGETWQMHQVGPGHFDDMMEGFNDLGTTPTKDFVPSYAISDVSTCCDTPRNRGVAIRDRGNPWAEDVARKCMEQVRAAALQHDPKPLVDQTFVSSGRGCSPSQCLPPTPGAAARRQLPQWSTGVGKANNPWAASMHAPAPPETRELPFGASAPPRDFPAFLSAIHARVERQIWAA